MMETEAEKWLYAGPVTYELQIPSKLSNRAKQNIPSDLPNFRFWLMTEDFVILLFFP